MWTRVVTGLSLLVAFLQAAPAQAPDQWPPAGVSVIGKDAVTAPHVVSQVKAAYTRAAVRAQVQGYVTMQFIVEIDGSVGEVRIVTSLDSASGLDDSAVAALKQWKFTPATKDGIAVRSMATMKMAFTLSGVPPPMTLPAGFPANDTLLADAKWMDDVAEAEGVRVHFSYPASYTSTAGGNAGIMVSLVNHQSMNSVLITRPTALTKPPAVPASVVSLQQFAETSNASIAQRGGDVDVIGVGQSPIGQTHWIWLEAQMRGLPTAPLPPDVAALAQGMFDGSHAWIFETAIGLHGLRVMCVMPTLSGLTDAGRHAATDYALAECAGII